jgi:hypothetical protein
MRPPAAKRLKREPQSSLLRLPREVRDIIYEYTVALGTDGPKSDNVYIYAWKQKSIVRPGEHLRRLRHEWLADGFAQTSLLQYVP